VSFDIDRLVRLWNGPLPPGDEAALADFRAVYIDRVTLNGAAVAVSELVAMARTMERSHENAERTVFDVTEGQDTAGRRQQRRHPPRRPGQRRDGDRGSQGSSSVSSPTG
jgi:hypothetical protein